MSSPLTIRMKADDTAEVLLYGVIGSDFFMEGITAKEFRKELKGIKSKTINLRINSPGGSVFEASAILNALDEHKADIVVDVDGIAASAASAVMMAGARPGRKNDRIRIAANAMVMIHNPHAIVMGGAAEMRQMADLLDKTQASIIDTYERKSGAGREQIEQWMNAETWFTGKEAVDAGFADEVTGAVQVAAFADVLSASVKLGAKHAPRLNIDRELAAIAQRAKEETEKRRRIAAQY